MPDTQAVLTALLADPPPASATADLGRVVRQRVLRRRALVGSGACAVAAGVVAASLIAAPGHDGRGTPTQLRVAAPAAAGATMPAPAYPTMSNAEIVSEFLPATGAETQPGRFRRLTHRVVDRAVAACTRARGLPAAAGPPEPPVHLEEVPDLDLIAQVGLSATAAGVPPGKPAPPCLGATDDGLDALSQVLESAVSSSLRQDWEKVLRSADSDAHVLADRAALGPCFAAHGVLAASEDEFFGYVDSRLARVSPSSFAAENVRLGGVYAACMAPLEARRERLRLAERPGFLAGHAAAVADLESRARAAVALVAQTGLTLDPT